MASSVDLFLNIQGSLDENMKKAEKSLGGIDDVSK